MFPSELREFPSAPCPAGGGDLDDSSRLDVVEIARDVSELVSFLVGLRTYQHTGKKILMCFCKRDKTQVCQTTGLTQVPVPTTVLQHFFFLLWYTFRLLGAQRYKPNDSEFDSRL